MLDDPTQASSFKVYDSLYKRLWFSHSLESQSLLAPEDKHTRDRTPIYAAGGDEGLSLKFPRPLQLSEKFYPVMFDEAVRQRSTNAHRFSISAPSSTEQYYGDRIAARGSGKTRLNDFIDTRSPSPFYSPSVFAVLLAIITPLIAFKL
ncbi:hypothetical protein JOM56_013512 [Amanita muscaria]